MKKLLLAFLLPACLGLPEARAQINDSLPPWFVEPFEVQADAPYLSGWDEGVAAVHDFFVQQVGGFGGGVDSDRRVGARRPARYRVTGAVVRYGKTEKGAVAVVRGEARSTATGKVVWRDEVRYMLDALDVSEGEYKAMFDKVMKPALSRLATSLKKADL